MPKRPLGTDAAGGMSSPTRPTGSLGDIMPNISTPSASEVVMTDFTPLQRVLLTANGNLQRLVSSYHNAPVSVSILKNERVADGRFSREVSISVFGVVFATARSTISVDCADYITAIVEKGLGIGQLFRHLKQCNHAKWQEYSLASSHSKLREGDDGAVVEVRIIRFWRLGVAVSHCSD